MYGAATLAPRAARLCQCRQGTLFCSSSSGEFFNEMLDEDKARLDADKYSWLWDVKARAWHARRIVSAPPVGGGGSAAGGEGDRRVASSAVISQTETLSLRQRRKFVEPGGPGYV